MWETHINIPLCCGGSKINRVKAHRVAVGRGGAVWPLSEATRRPLVKLVVCKHWLDFCKMAPWASPGTTV